MTAFTLRKDYDQIQTCHDWIVTHEYGGTLSLTRAQPKAQAANETNNKRQQAKSLEGSIQIGTSIDTAFKLMPTGNDRSYAPAMVSSDPKYDLFFWPVGQGLLIATYAVKERTIKHLAYYLSDDRPKSQATTFTHQVSRYHPKTGALVLKVATTPLPKKR